MRHRQQRGVSVRVAGNGALFSATVGTGDVDCGIELPTDFDTLPMLSFSRTLTWQLE